MSDRHLDWEGCFNVRDLGGLPTRDGRAIRRGALVRGDTPDGLTAAGWTALADHGVRTIVDLRNDDELDPGSAAQRPDEVTTVHIPIDGVEDTEFWSVWANTPAFGTPVYYRPFLDRFPDRAAAAVRAVAQAEPGGGVLVHCGGGRDRAGLVTMLLLSLAGVAPEEIAADYALSIDRLPTRYAALGEPDQTEELQGYLRDRGTTAGEVIVSLLAELDVERYLRAAGLEPEEIEAVRRRLVG